jgi:putative transposase
LWVADLTYVAIAVGFVYVALILDAWSRRVVGYAISRRIDTRLTLAALQAAVETLRPPRRLQRCSLGSIRAALLIVISIYPVEVLRRPLEFTHYAADIYRQALADFGLRGSMGRRGEPYDNAKDESFMKTLKCEHVF